ncbi:MAG TPA: Xaa-Pro peptidase family protein [bacterium]|nr:Xaa-Pro peptidase family protein [bacterium]
MRWTISEDEFRGRQVRVREALARRGLGGLCLFSPTQVFYLTGFAFIQTERPIGFAFPREGRSVLFVPQLEAEHSRLHALVDQVEAYPEYPGRTHPMKRFAEICRELGLGSGRVGVDGDGYGGGYGYRGPALSELLADAKIVPSRDLIEEMIAVKSPEEVTLIRESAKWGNLAHTLLQQYTRPGLTETEVSGRASFDATQAMIRTLGPSYRPLSWLRAGAYAGYRGQIGKDSALPHSLTTNAVFRAGDVLVTGAASGVGGYGSELERTMIIGKPDDRQRRYFDLMVGAQQAAFDAIRPGAKCSDVDHAVMAFFEQHDLMSCWRHHTGHALGMGIHEGPFFDVGDHTPMVPGMVFSVEPGIYIPGYAGFRHSDTVLVTEDGMEMITYYPRMLEDLVIDA